MQLTHKHTISEDYLPVVVRLKKVLEGIDQNAEMYLFGSRARGDAADESDWDVLVLTPGEDLEAIAATMRRQVRIEVEMVYHVAVSLIVKNKRAWESEYIATGLYQSISEEGVKL